MKKGMKFETALKELEKIVENLEKKEMPLEKALSTFEQGVKLSRYCNQLLEQAEKKVKSLTEKQDKEGNHTGTADDSASVITLGSTSEDKAGKQ